MDYHEQNKIKTISNWLGAGSINIFGMPFAGKDTHGRELARILDGPLIGGGDIIRNSEAEDVKKIINDGSLAPSEQYKALVLPYLQRKEFKDRPLILSSVGRWYGEHETIVATCEKAGHPLKAVLYLSIDVEEVLRRWHIAQELKDRGDRDDDDHHKLDRRLEEFQSKTIPVINFYRKENLLIEIDGRPPREAVLNNIIDHLYEFAAR